jgi:hypothetical protein
MIRTREREKHSISRSERGGKKPPGAPASTHDLIPSIRVHSALDFMLMHSEGKEFDTCWSFESDVLDGMGADSQVRS